jgi:hypothetical protein
VFAYHQHEKYKKSQFDDILLLDTQRKCVCEIPKNDDVTIASKPINFVRSEGMNHHQFKVSVHDMESKCGNCVVQKFIG